MNPSIVRSRWAAIGAAVAVTIGAGGIGLVSATSPADATAYIPIEPCRVADTRNVPEFNVGPRNTPIGAMETHVITAHGDNGECTGIPTSATGLQLNVTSLNATAGTFLAIWGAGDQPNASSLNPQPGQPPIPNAVTTGLTPAGAFNVYNQAGTVDIIVDIVGFYSDHNHDDRYYTEAESNNRFDNGDAGGAYDQNDTLTSVDEVVASFTIDTPGVGYLTVNASTSAFALGMDSQVRCSITTGTEVENGHIFLSDVPVNRWQSLSGTRTFTFGFVSIPGETTVNLVCDASAGSINLGNSHLSGVFTPDPDAQFKFIQA